MKSRLSITFALVALPLLFAGEKNLVPNADFSDGLEHWKVTFPEPNETKYAENHKHCSIVRNPDGPGKALLFTIPPKVAASEGVKALTPLIRIDPRKSYEFGADIRTTGTEPIVFIEAYEEDPSRTEKGSDAYEGFVRTYRATLFAKHNVKGRKNEWVRCRREIHPWTKPKRYWPTHMAVKLYAFWPTGEVHWRNVVLREIPRPKELEHKAKD